jgi:integrase
VQNAKITQGRGVGLTRTLFLDDFTDEHISHLQWMTNAAQVVGKGDARGFSALQARTVAMMYRTCRTLWPQRQNHYTLYTFRHQFLANAKGRFDPVGVAALAGHATDETASKHYGRRRYAWIGSAVLPLPSPSSKDVEAVRHRLQLFSERMERTHGRKPRDLSAMNSKNK